MARRRSAVREALLVGAAVSATVAVGTLTLRPELTDVVWVARPLATLLLLAFAATPAEPVSSRYRVLMALGLLAAFGGDLLRMLPSDQFLPSLASLFVAQVSVFAAFTSRSSLLRYKAGVIGYAAVATVVLALIVPVVGGMVRTALIGYVIVISLVASQAASWMLDDLASRAARLAALGASCFVASEAIYLLDRFVFVLPARDLMVLAPFWLGLACLATSVDRPPPPAMRL